MRRRASEKGKGRILKRKRGDEVSKMSEEKGRILDRKRRKGWKERNKIEMKNRGQR